MKENKRKSGILMPVASLPGPYGIGSFSKSAFEFIDFLEASGQTLWQILPLGPTSFGDSPYQSFSTFAGNPYFIDPEALMEEGLLRKKECLSFDFGSDPEKVDYALIYKARFKMLRLAYDRFESSTEYERFCDTNKYWLDDYALYMAIKDSLKGLSLAKWPEELRLRRRRNLIEARRAHEDEAEFYRFQQFLFMKQWMKVKKYANDRGIRIIGDIPIYVAYDSSDVWAEPGLFQLDKSLTPTAVAGCPPDFFSPTGQLWGNPLYNWEYHRDTDYRWWVNRIEHCFKLYDIVRIDHFRGFEQYYSIPWGDETAENGEWLEGPGYSVFSAIKSRIGEKPLIAEDLGLMTPGVKKLLKKTGFPGMKVLQFAFEPEDCEWHSPYLPHNFRRNCVVYTGTHDNDTTEGWYKSLKNNEKKAVRTYLRVNDGRKVREELVRMAEASVAELCVIPVQDWLGLGAEARINIPSTLGGNWDWRMKEGALTDKLSSRILEMTRLYGRLPYAECPEDQEEKQETGKSIKKSGRRS
ncbi:MAG: 4-alpha-glucanotransferase [Lachnospiraceae bacterium]|nr:4-alpha-glucanotransferase [Lachnospiraceae bacterium]